MKNIRLLVGLIGFVTDSNPFESKVSELTTGHVDNGAVRLLVANNE